VHGTNRKQKQMKNNIQNDQAVFVRKPWLALLVAGILGLGSATNGLADNSPVLKASGKSYYGKTYGEWVVAYWQWAMSIPMATNPWANDPTGAYAAIGQSGPVWFLGGSLGDSVTRYLTIPADKAIFLPVHQWIFGATVFDCDPSNPGVTCDVTALRQSAAESTKAAVLLEVFIDGQPVSDVKDYRTKSPGTGFSVTIPEDNLPTFFGQPVPAGTYGPHVADGYYMLLSPLSAGSHTISVHVVSSLGIEYVITYNIIVGE
jgi:hypothetical protein